MVARRDTNRTRVKGEMKEINGKILGKCYICGKNAESFFQNFNCSDPGFEAERERILKGIKPKKEQLVREFKDNIKPLLKKIENLPDDVSVEDTPSLADIKNYMVYGLIDSHSRSRRLTVSESKQALTKLLGIVGVPAERQKLPRDKSSGPIQTFLEQMDGFDEQETLVIEKKSTFIVLFRHEIEEYYHVNGSRLTREEPDMDPLDDREEHRRITYHLAGNSYESTVDESEVIHIHLVYELCHVCENMFSNAAGAAWSVLKANNDDD